METLIQAGPRGGVLVLLCLTLLSHPRAVDATGEGARQDQNGARKTTAALAVSHQTPARPTSDAGDTDARHDAVVKQYCVTCHNDRSRAGDLSLQTASLAHAGGHAEVWEKVLRKLRTDAMPPAGRPRPDPETRQAFIAAIEASLDRAASGRPDPGRTAAFHRLNRAEYQNAVRDLIALETNIAALLPPDGQNFGFDNNGDALAMSPLLLDRYLSVARRVARLAIGSAAPPAVAETYHAPSDFGQDHRLEGLPYGTRGGLQVSHHFPRDGEYELRIRLARNYNFLVVDLFEPHQIEVMIDGARVKLMTVEPVEPPPGASDEDRGLGAPQGDENLQFRVPVRAGTRRVAVTFIKRPSAELVEDRLPFLRGDPKENALHGLPWIGELTVTGPFAPAAAADTPSRQRIFSCRPTGPADEERCAADILTTLGRRAFRRPLVEEDRAALRQAFREGRRLGGSFEAGIELGLQRILLSPSFLFRIELDPPGVQPNTVYRVSDLALASRLSFFLWSSIPDDTLLRLAEQRQLNDPVVLEQQVRRMLADPRAEVLARNFAGQWLELRKLEEAAPDQRTFPNFDRNLRDGLRRETELFFESIVREDRPLGDLLNADYTYMNERVARHYGVGRVYGDRFRRVTVTNAARRGLLGHGSILTVTSYPNRTSPVLRGVWILDNLLGSPPPPPPPDVPDLEETNHGGQLLSMRARMAQHRSNPTCASCHAVMDPLGLALEHFDATGGWRARSESGEPVDASGALPGGATFDGVEGLRRVLLERSDVFYTTFTEKLLTYALGRGLTAADGPSVRGILRAAAGRDYRAQAVITSMVTSVPFQMKRASQTASAATGAR
jgi:mono/diheme cytochrome c family protein